MDHATVNATAIKRMKVEMRFMTSPKGRLLERYYTEVVPSLKANWWDRFRP
jgi:hypothetical protein